MGKMLANIPHPQIWGVGVCLYGEYTSEPSFVKILDPGLDGGATNDPDLKSALLNGYHQVWRGTDNYFRSKCSKKGWRPRKKRSEEEESTDDEPAAWDPTGWIGTPNVAAQEFMVPYMVPPWLATTTQRTTPGNTQRAPGKPPLGIPSRCRYRYARIVVLTIKALLRMPTARSAINAGRP